MEVTDKNFIPYGKQDIDQDDIKAVVDVLQSDRLTAGPMVDLFEKELAAYCGAKHAIAVSNGTAALHLAMLAAKIGPGDRVLTSPNTFLASSNCAAYVGGTPDFIDIDDVSYNLSPEILATHWTDDVRAVISVDFAGYPSDMPKITEIAHDRNALVIEDACHAIGAEFYYQNRWHKIGGHPYADMTIFSFHPVKTITTGEGGAILTEDDALAERCRLLRNHGMTRNPDKFLKLLKKDLHDIKATPTSYFPWYYEMLELGFNYRITDIQCALGLSQLKKVDRFIKKRQQIVDKYNKAFSNLKYLKIPLFCNSVKPSWHLYVLKFDFKSIGLSRFQVMKQLQQSGIGTQVHYIPVYLQPFYLNKYGYKPGKCPVAESLYKSCLSLPLYPSMSEMDINRVIRAITSIIEG